MRIGQASIDENGKAHGGKAGDQNGKEVKISNWYKYGSGWNVVIRPKDRAKAHKMAEAMKAACANNNIGYDQYQRESLLTEVKKVGNDFSKVTTPTETDCSALVATIIVATGTDEAKMRNPARKNALAYTGDLEQLCKATGEFEFLKDSKYLTSGDYLLEGDIILNTKSHVVMAIENGSKASAVEPSVPAPAPAPAYPKLGSQGDKVREIQTNLNKVGYNLKVDGDWGKNTDAAVKDFQKKNGMDPDGEWGPKSEAAMNKALASLKPTGYQAKVTARNGLNVRTGPGTNYSKARNPLPYGTTVTVLSEQNGWGKIGDSQYIALQYTQKI